MRSPPAGAMSYLSQPRSVRRVTEREAFEERRVTGDASGHAGRLHVVASGVVSIRALPEIPRVGEIAFEFAGAGAHAEAGVDVVRPHRTVLPSPVEVDRGRPPRSPSASSVAGDSGSSSEMLTPAAMLRSGVNANFSSGVIVDRVSYGRGISGLSASASSVALTPVLIEP